MEKCISVDSGKSSTKIGVYDPASGETTKSCFRTKMGRGYFIDDALEKNTVIMEYDGKTYKIGQGAVTEADMEISKKSEIHKNCTIRAIAGNVSASETDEVHVAIGMPVKEWENVQKRIDYKNYILPDGDIHVRMKSTPDGEIIDKTFRIVSKHVYPETQGALFVRERPHGGTQGVVDLGHLNNNCTIWNGVDMDSKYTLTDVLGGNNLVTGLAQELTATFSLCDEKTVARTLLLPKEERFLHSNRPNPEIEQRSKEIISEYLMNHVKEIRKGMDLKRWPLDYIDLTFIGGTVELLENEIHEVFGEAAFIPDDPKFANVLGFLRVMCGKIYNKDVIHIGKR